MKHVLRVGDLTAPEILDVLDAAERTNVSPVLANKGVALLFEHPSARTRNAAEMAVVQLGGHPVSLRGEEVGIDVRESAEDLARTLASFHAVIGARVAKHGVLERMAAALDDSGFDVPVVNLLSDLEHPSQLLADLLTIRQEFGALEGRTLAYIGDANNVARSLLVGCVLMGMHARVACPSGFAFSADEIATLSALGSGTIDSGTPAVMADQADVLYTDVWVSMGEQDGANKRVAFDGFTIDASLVQLAAPEAIVMHCLPAHRGKEISAEVMEGQRSRIWAQAQNRMHALRGLLSLLYESPNVRHGPEGFTGTATKSQR